MKGQPAKLKTGTENTQSIPATLWAHTTRLVLLRLGSWVGSHSPRCLLAWCSKAKPPVSGPAPHGQAYPVEDVWWLKFSSWRLSLGAWRLFGHRPWCQIKVETRWNLVGHINLEESWYLFKNESNSFNKGNSNVFRGCLDSPSMPRFLWVKRIPSMTWRKASGLSGTQPARSNPRRNAHCFSAWHHPRRWYGVEFKRNLAMDINTTRLSASQKAKTSLALFKCSGVKSTRSVTSTASCEYKMCILSRALSNQRSSSGVLRNWKSET